jgi:hypothetical protein
VIFVSGKCASCGKYWELHEGQVHPPADAFIDVKDDGTHTAKILCVNSQSCGGRH